LNTVIASAILKFIIFRRSPMRKMALLTVAAISILSFTRLSAQTPLKGAVALTLPPYVIQESNNGIEVDIVRNVLEKEGYSLQLDYVPFARLAENLAGKKDDCVLTISEASGVKDVYYSDSHITYQNVVVTLKSKNFKIASVADLAGLRVVAFGDAPTYLGGDFAAMAKANGKYSEIADQSNQVKFLFLGRADAIVMDVNIFKYFRRSIKDADVGADVVISQIFPPTAYKVAFADKSIRDKFNAGLKQLKASGGYSAIFDKYLK